MCDDFVTGDEIRMSQKERINAEFAEAAEAAEEGNR